jgi:hypothetical protein
MRLTKYAGTRTRSEQLTWNGCGGESHRALSIMKPYQERVVAEKRELDARRERLDLFIDSDTFDTLDQLDQALLVVQADAMTTYSGVLAQRILRFK